MPKPARDRLAQLLAGTQPSGADSALLRLPGDAFTLDVAGLGPIRTPIRAAEAKRLIGAAQPARFGRGEETLSDASVRDTWELTPDQVRIGGPRWGAHLDAALEQFCEELGLPDGARLTAELHSMLVYGKGQFFLSHQDSEKHGEMVASLVVMLPSVHTGGELVIDDAGQERTYRGSRNDLVLVAFYADRRHEVRPVRSGYRVTLTFNLLLTSRSAAASGGPVMAAASYLTEHFTTRAQGRYGGRDLGEPARLGFLLDHEYTERGLAAGRLKGSDAERVATLRAAAEQAGCETVLALAEIKETWDVLPAEDTWRHDWYDEDGDDDYDGDYTLNELIDDEITLGWWVSPDGSGAETIRLPLGEDEVCAVTPTKSLTPYDSEYEGYMGNYGNTLDRWYRRAAVVVWPKERSFAVRAEAAPAWALQTLLERIGAGGLDAARVDAASLRPFWLNVEPALLAPALRLAAALRDATLAELVAAPFRLEAVTADHAALLAALAREYGDSWLLSLMSRWQAANRYGGGDRLTWVTEALLPLCQALRQHDANRISDGCAAQAWHWLRSQIHTWVNHAHAGRRRTSLLELGVLLARVLEAASDELGATIAETLRAYGNTMIDLVVPALRAHQPPPNPALVILARDCHGLLTRLNDRPARDPDDWSIAFNGCGCELCDRLTRFLRERHERTHEWPLAQQGRQHVHQQIDAAGLPVRHTTRRQGRPFTLLLTKTDDLFDQENQVRRQARTDLTWLASTFGMGEPASPT